MWLLIEVLNIYNIIETRVEFTMLNVHDHNFYKIIIEILHEL